MRVALLQIRVRTRSRSANLAHVLGQVVRAVEAVPAPDLVLLPAGCEGPVSQGLSPAMVQGFAESLAAVAREWGVYLAAGLLRRQGDGFGEVARLYDPDGDVLIRSAKLGPDATCVLRPTPLGRLAVGLDFDDAPVAPPADPCDLLLVHGRWKASAKQRRRACARLHTRFSQLARRIGAPVCAVGSVSVTDDAGSASSIGGSGLWASDGACILAAGARVEETLFAEVADGGSEQSAV